MGKTLRNIVGVASVALAAGVIGYLGTEIARYQGGKAGDDADIRPGDELAVWVKDCPTSNWQCAAKTVINQKPTNGQVFTLVTQRKAEPLDVPAEQIPEAKIKSLEQEAYNVSQKIAANKETNLYSFTECAESLIVKGCLSDGRKFKAELNDGRNGSIKGVILRFYEKGSEKVEYSSVLFQENSDDLRVDYSGEIDPKRTNGLSRIPGEEFEKWMSLRKNIN